MIQKMQLPCTLEFTLTPSKPSSPITSPALEAPATGQLVSQALTDALLADRTLLQAYVQDRVANCLEQGGLSTRESRSSHLPSQQLLATLISRLSAAQQVAINQTPHLAEAWLHELHYNLRLGLHDVSVSGSAGGVSALVSRYADPTPGNAAADLPWQATNLASNYLVAD